ncbi:MAG: condensation domain-containing protein, partial [Tumebacillaceae bacterium]
PTIAQLAKEIETLLQQKTEQSSLPLVRHPRETKMPMSFAQQRLWFLEQLEPQNIAYNIPMTIRIQGDLNVDVLWRAVDEVIKRHEALRTNFTSEDGKPIQVITPEVSLDLRVVDLRHLPVSERKPESIRLAEDEVRKPFDLQSDLLLRTVLLQLADDEYVMLLTIHHIIADGWSLNVLVQELSQLYKAFLEGQESPLDELPIQYADHAIWQRQHLQGDVLDEQLRYWLEQLAGELPTLELPTDRPRASFQSFKGGTHYFTVSDSCSKHLMELTRKENVTLFMTLVAGFKTLLHRYTGQEDIILGSPIANRNRFEIEGLIGLFVNTLSLRTDLSGNPSFSELLQRVRNVSLGAFAHQDLPFEHLIEALHLERDTSRNPLLQVKFALQNPITQQVELPGIQLSAVDVERGTSKFDLTLFMWETEQGLAGRFEYDSQLFDKETILRMEHHFITLLEGIVADPSQRIAELPILSTEEVNQMMSGWNDTTVEYPDELCIHHLFEQQVEETPNRIAVREGERVLTYRELDERANSLAQELRALGVQPNVLVGICMDRSLEMAVAVLGVLKAGGAYVPIDPSFPQERKAYMLSDTKAPVLLTKRHLLTELRDHQASII